MDNKCLFSRSELYHSYKDVTIIGYGGKLRILRPLSCFISYDTGPWWTRFRSKDPQFPVGASYDKQGGTEDLFYSGFPFHLLLLALQLRTSCHFSRWVNTGLPNVCMLSCLPLLYLASYIKFKPQRWRSGLERWPRKRTNSSRDRPKS